MRLCAVGPAAAATARRRVPGAGPGRGGPASATRRCSLDPRRPPARAAQGAPKQARGDSFAPGQTAPREARAPRFETRRQLPRAPHAAPGGRAPAAPPCTLHAAARAGPRRACRVLPRSSTSTRTMAMTRLFDGKPRT